MCMVSNVGDQWRDDFPKRWPNFPPFPELPKLPESYPPVFVPASVSKAELEALRKEVEELKKLLQAAKKFDDRTGQADCEIDEKVALIKAIAKMVGVDLEDVFGKHT